jgi:hypothetical protein
MILHLMYVVVQRDMSVAICTPLLRKTLPEVVAG